MNNVPVAQSRALASKRGAEGSRSSGDTINAEPQEKAGTRGSSATQSPEPPAGSAPLRRISNSAQAC